MSDLTGTGELRPALKGCMEQFVTHGPFAPFVPFITAVAGHTTLLLLYHTTYYHLICKKVSYATGVSVSEKPPWTDPQTKLGSRELHVSRLYTRTSITRTLAL